MIRRVFFCFVGSSYNECMSDEPRPKTLAELSFEEAETSFKKFLDGQGFGSEVHWVFREDVIIVGGGVFLRTPLPADNRERARECFELGKHRDFHAFGILDGVPLRLHFSAEGRRGCSV